MNYTVNITGYYEPINFIGAFHAMGAYYMANGTWLVVGLDGGNSNGNIWLGIGTNGANLQWQKVGTANVTVEMEVAAFGSHIQIVYAEMNASENDNYGLTQPVKWLNCYGTDDWGTHWIKTNIMDCSSLNSDWFPGLSIAANSTTFECMWGFANATRQDNTTISDALATIMEAHDWGNGWSFSENLTVTIGTPAAFPQVFFDQFGTMYVCINYNANPSTDQVLSYLIQLPYGPNGFGYWWLLTPSLTVDSGISPAVYCTYDISSDYYYFIYDSDYPITGIRNASSWGSSIGPLQAFHTEQHSNHYFNLFAGNQRPKIFSPSITSISYSG